MATSTSRKVGAGSNCEGNKIPLKSEASTSRKKIHFPILPLVEISLKIFHGDVITSNLLLVEKLILFHGSANTLHLLLVEKNVQYK